MLDRIDILRYLYSKVFPKTNGKDYNKTEVVIKLIYGNTISVLVFLIFSLIPFHLSF